MIENNFNNRDFERFVKQNADQYRMFPSDKVWKAVHNALHTRRRWYGIGLALLLLTTAVVTVVMLYPGEKNGKLAITIGQLAISENKTPEKSSPVIAVIAPSRNPVNSSNNRTFTTLIQPNLLGSEPAIQNPTDADQYNYTSLDINTQEVIADTKELITPNNVTPTKQVDKIITEPVVRKQNDPATLVELTPIEKTPVSPDIAKNEEKKDLVVPFTIESVVNAYKHKAGKKKLGWELFFTPTISYRRLSENTEFISATRYNSIVNGAGTSPSSYSTDVNSVVNHKPDLGFQLGVKASYPVSKWFSLTAGLQLGVSKYDIKAYDHSAEVTTIALSTARAGAHSVSTMSNYRNGSGQKENWLRNFYFSASIPVGMELKLSDGTKNYFGFGTTLQPTYVLDNRAYMISTDYKNYAEVPSLTRRFNLNTSFEFFSAHTTGKVKWRIGPQVHYQVMSSFIKNYPIKEHLFDFGLKLGVTLR